MPSHVLSAVELLLLPLSSLAELQAGDCCKLADNNYAFRISSVTATLSYCSFLRGAADPSVQLGQPLGFPFEAKGPGSTSISARLGIFRAGSGASRDLCYRLTYPVSHLYW